jgi:hypothetical protein
LRLPQISSREYFEKSLTLGLPKRKPIGKSTTQKPKGRSVAGYSTHDHLILDLDGSKSTSKAVRLVRLIQAEYPDVGSCLICESSAGKHHAIFNGRLPWSRVLHICRALAGLGALDKNFIKIRSFREDLTLRVSPVARSLGYYEAPVPVAFVRSEGAHTGFSGIDCYLKALLSSQASFGKIKPRDILPLNFEDNLKG